MHLGQRAAKGVSGTPGQVFAASQKLIQAAGKKNAASEKMRRQLRKKMQPLCLIFGSSFLAQNVREYFNHS